MSSIGVVLVGLGPIGVEVGRALAGRADLELWGAADPSPTLVGQELDKLLGPAAAPSLRVASNADEIYAAVSADRLRHRVAVLCTGSRIESVAPQIEAALEAGFHVVSTCEELAFPGLRHGRLAVRLDALAREHRLAILGTGVNPGLVMDRLPLVVAQGCVRVDRIRVTRVVDAAMRRGPLRLKVGAGLGVAEFRQGVADGRLGHVGLLESAMLLARGLGVRGDELVEKIDPVVADVDGHGVQAGQVLGVRQLAQVVEGGVARVELELAMYVGAPSPHDRIVVEGDPPLDVRVEGGYQGDRATVGTVLNAIPRVVEGAPGLRTVTSLS